MFNRRTNVALAGNGLVLGEVVDFKAQKLIKLQMLNRITNAE